MQKKHIVGLVLGIIIVVIIGCSMYIFFKYSQNSSYEEEMFVSKEVENHARSLC